MQTVYSSDFSLEGAKNVDEPEDDEEEETQEPIKWINIIFLPYQAWWQWIILVAVCIKCTMAPVHGISRSLNCGEDSFKGSAFLSTLYFLYTNVTDILLVIDIMLHIIHRQVAEEAMKREYIPKSGLLICVDISTIIPFLNLVANEICKPIKLWPHIVHFHQTLVIPSFFSLNKTHSYFNLLFGYFVMLALTLNILTCFHLLLTYHGTCERCGFDVQNNLFDWRQTRIEHLKRYNYSDDIHYYFALNFVGSHVSFFLEGEDKPITYIELFITNCYKLFSYSIIMFVLMPKLFGEILLRIKNIYTFHPRVIRIIEETERRNCSGTAHLGIESFYSLLWKKRKGIISMPKAIQQFPKYIVGDIKLDLSWGMFYHSPTFRKTSTPYKRYFSDFVEITYKQPGERFFSGSHCYSNLYYLKSGIVQLISCDDSASPLLSVTGGTIFGDISFYIPPQRRQISARCMTYCEVSYISRANVLRTLHKFPNDRRNIMNSVRERLKHAHSLYKRKEKLKGEDRTEDEQITWLKRRWWQISVAIQHWKISENKSKKCELPPEEQSHHCAKFIGQLVLCDEAQLHKKSNFIKMTFPWALDPNSHFCNVWNRIITVIVYLVLFIHPPNILRLSIDKPRWFTYFSHFVDLMYGLDILITLATAIENEGTLLTNIWSIADCQIKNAHFIMDLLSTPPVERAMKHVLEIDDVSQICKFNRLIKIHILFDSKKDEIWHKKINPTRRILFSIPLILFINLYLVSYINQVGMIYTWKIQTNYKVNFYCSNDTYVKFYGCYKEITDFLGVLAVFYGYLIQIFAPILEEIQSLENEKNQATRLALLGLAINHFTTLIRFFVLLYLKMKYISAYYMKYRDRVNYQYFVSTLKDHYKRLRIHPDLLKRLENYLNCHWMYYNGIDILHPHLLKDEPHDVYHKLHGEVAEKIIGESRAFVGANPLLIKELAKKASFLILPRNTTLVMFGVKVENVTWIARGVTKVECHDETGETLKFFIPNGNMLAMAAIFMDRPALRTYTSVSDVEILYITTEEFYLTLKRYGTEWEYIQKCKEEIGPLLDEFQETALKKYKNYQKKLRERIFHARQSVSLLVGSEKKKNFLSDIKIPDYFKDYRKNPESKLIIHWFTFRAVITILHIYINSMRRMFPNEVYFGIYYFQKYLMISIVLLGMILKVFQPYYDARGLVITNIRKCAIRYFTRGFLLDMIMLIIVPQHQNVTHVMDSQFGPPMARTLAKLCAFCNIHLIIGLFYYQANKPSSNSILLLISNWQIVTLLICSFSSFMMFKLCMKEDIKKGEHIIVKETVCWLPPHNLVFENNPIVIDYWLLFAKASEFVMYAFLGISIGYSQLDQVVNHVLPHNLFLAVYFWVQENYCLTLLILYYRGNSLFQNEVTQLKNFLKSERVEADVIDRSLNYFNYLWKRTTGVNMKILMNERIGVIFRQDLNYYFFKKTFKALDSLLQGGETLERLLACSASEQFFLPGDDIVREMDLSPNLFIVHRGKVVVRRNKEKLAILTRGSLFGQLEGTSLRPVYVTATAVDRTDILVIPVKKFQDNIGNEVRMTIARNKQSTLDFMAVKKTERENPYNSIEYILRGVKSIKLPRMRDAVNVDNSKWYERWLLLTWVIGPVLASTLALILITLPKVTMGFILGSLLALDSLHVFHMITDFYSVELVVENDTCVLKRQTKKKMMRPWFYIDLLSLLIPIITAFTGNWKYQVARLLRIYSLYFYDKQICRSLKSRVEAVFLKFVCVFLLLHTLACGWILVACRRGELAKHPWASLRLPEEMEKRNDFTSWIYKYQRPEGCIIMSPAFKSNTGLMQYVFLTPRYFEADYLIAWTFIFVILTGVNHDVTLTVTTLDMWYTAFMTYTLNLIQIWCCSITISYVYTKYREMYHFDYQSKTLINFLACNGVSRYLRDAFQNYMELVWQKRQGNWLPNIANQAPLCIREDMLGSLYMHHLLGPAVFQVLPHYFLRQLAVQFERIILFPGSCIVSEGDINPRMYFIHEGEVEKWYTDRKGESKLHSLLTINDFFGVVPGLFPNTPYANTYYTRTVVDLMILKYEKWQYLLDAYPDIKYELYKTAIKLGTETKPMSKTSLISKTSKTQN